MLEFQVGEHLYRSSKMNAFRQFAVMKRILPLVTALGPMAGRAAGAEGPTDLTAVAGPLIDAISRMSDADSEFIITECLSVCQRQSGTSWQSVWNQAAARPQFDDIDLMGMLQIAWQVIQDNLSGFLAALPATSTEATQAGPASPG